MRFRLSCSGIGECGTVTVSQVTPCLSPAKPVVMTGNGSLKSAVWAVVAGYSEEVQHPVGHSGGR